MRGLPLILVCFCCYAQDPLSLVREWIPLNIGDRWVYDYESRNGPHSVPEIERSQKRITVTSIETIPEGTLVHRSVDGGAQSESNILVRDNCLYILHSFRRSGNGAYGWDEPKQQLTEHFRADLLKGTVLPTVCLPLAIGKTWGDPNKGRDLWTVAGMGAKNPDDPSSVTPDSWRLEAGLASGDDDYIWFKKGVGIMAERTYHNGTYSDYRVSLVRFDAVPR